MSSLDSKSKKKPKKKVSFDPSAKDAEPASKTTEDGEETLWETMGSSRFVQATPFVLVLFILYKGFYFFVLQRPDLLTTLTMGLVKLRPAVSVSDERQLLILGSISGGTTQTAADLYDYLGLEVEHEKSNAETDFCRDGTVSWFHAVRFFKPPDDNKLKTSALAHLCTDPIIRDNLGFHPRTYRPQRNCSNLKRWSKCWASACFKLLHSEWGCALETQTSCETPFRATLHQTRHPLRTIESLVAKYCKEGSMNPSFLKYMSIFFPQHDWKSLSCIEAAAQYVVEYHTTLLEAEDVLDGRYKIEEQSPCDVARMAGLLDKSSTVYAPNYDRVVLLCGESDKESPAQQVMKSTRLKVNKGRVKLAWEDLRGGKKGSQRPEGDTELEEQVKALVVKLGYELNESPAPAKTSEQEGKEL